MLVKNHRRVKLGVATAAVALAAIACGGADDTAMQPTVAPATSTPLSTAAATPEPPTPEPTPTESAATPTPDPTATPTPAATPTPTPTPEPALKQVEVTEFESENFAWRQEQLDSGTKPSLDLAADGTPHVAYMLEVQRGWVKSAKRVEDGWQIDEVARGYFYGPLDVAVGPDDRPRIVYHDHQDTMFQLNAGDATLAFPENGEWKTKALVHAGHDGWDTRIVIDEKGVVHVSGIDPETFRGNGVEYYRFEPGSSSPEVDRLPSGPLEYRYATALDLDTSGTPYITYYDQEEDALILASKEGDEWTLETVDADGKTGLFSSLVIDQNDRIHISYFEDTSDTKDGAASGTVKYATRGLGESAWTIREVGKLENIFFGFEGARNATSVQVDSQGNPWIAYTDERKSNLAVWDGSAWTTDEIIALREEEDSPLGQLVVMKLDADDQPHLTYFRVTGFGPLDGNVFYLKGMPR